MASALSLLQIDPSIDISHSANEKSLAFTTARTRWPKVVAAAIADVQGAIGEPWRNDAEAEDGKQVVSDLGALLSAMQNDAGIRPIPEDGAGDIESFNAELESLGPMSWHSSPWLYTECHLYRLIQTCFSRRTTTFWKNYDVFEQQKTRALASSKTSIVELAQFLHRTSDIEAKAVHDRALLEEMLEVSLWGNAADLLLLVHLTAQELQSRQGNEARRLLKQNVVDNDIDEICKFLCRLKDLDKPREIHIVLDNAGFELAADLAFVVYLLSSNHASTIVLHGKTFPWFVSDATARDFDFTVQTLRQASFSGEVTSREEAELKAFGEALARYMEDGRLRYEAHPFWTTQHCYARMPAYAPDLWKALVDSELVIFKGDLNYRKLVFDGLWPRTTTFQHALGELGKFPKPGQPGIRILSLRTCKADTVVGLEPGKEEEIDPHGTSEWSRNGKYAVISFFDGKFQE